MFQPPATPAAKSRVSKVSYTVKKGDTLESIAQRYKVSVDDLRRWNTIGRLSAGQKLSIQVTTTATASSKKTTARKSPAKNGKRVSVSMKPPAR